jgi:biotin carboxyl carrier protein
MAKKENKSTKATASKGDDGTKVRFNTLEVHGIKYKTLFTEKYKNRKKWEEPDFRKILSVISGTVIKIYVKEGQKVKEGELMMVLEAMKMQNKICFPMDGVVKKIYVTEEEKVPKGHLMIELQ